MGIQDRSRLIGIAIGVFCVSMLYACGGGNSGGSVNQDTIGQPVPPQPLVPKLAAAVVLDDGVGIGAAAFPKGSGVSGGQGQSVQGLSCLKMAKSSPSFGYTHLNLIVDGQQIAVPENIGLVNQGNSGITDLASKATGCAYPVLTSDTSGKIRTQVGNALPYTLGQFFALWGQPLSEANVAGYTGKPVKVFVKDGITLSEYSGNLEALPLAANREITIQIGSALTQIPNFEWNDLPRLSVAPVVIKRGATGPSNGQSGLEDNLFNNKGGQGDAVDSLLCYGPRNQSQLKEVYHAHSHLAIYEDGVRLFIPPFIGIVGNDTVLNTFCVYPLHTHDATGTIHVEPVNNNLVTLGQFFKIWGQPLTKTNVAGQAGTPVVIYIKDGGNLRKYQGDPSDIELKSYRSIVIQLGTPLAEIPTFDLTDEVQ